MKRKIRKIRDKINFALEEDAERLLRDAMQDFTAEGETKRDADETAERSPPVTAKTAKNRQPFYELDLHGYTLAESQRLVDQLFAEIIAANRVKVKIITGKGRHSKGEGNFLARDMHEYVVQKYQRYIVEIEESPYRVRLGNLPIRGHFEVILKGETMGGSDG